MRLRGYYEDVPKPMVTVGARPILWHLMKYYAHYGHKEFILCLGYKGNVIKDYFLHYEESVSNDFVWIQGGKKIEYRNRDIDDWTITFVHTGASANIGERLKAVQPYVAGEEMFLANYSDGLTDLHLPSYIDSFRETGGIGRMLLVRPTASFDLVSLASDGVVSNIHALSSSNIWINGGFFVFRKEVFDYMRPGEELVREPFERLIAHKALSAYKHPGFWACMDTFKDKQHLEELNSKEIAPWHVWKNNEYPAVDTGWPDRAVAMAGGA
jgi:glucose-1-phosphate cytidylyltransferase